MLGFVAMGGMPRAYYCLVYFLGSSVLLLCGCRFFFGSGPAWSLVVKLVKLSFNNSSRVFNSFIRFVI